MNYEQVTTPKNKIKGVKNSKKQITKHYKGRFLNTQNNSCMLLCCY
jgi:hypothetical protein